MEIKNFIKIYDECLPYPCIGNIIRFVKNSEFEASKVGGNGVVNFDIRRVHTHALSNLKNSLSDVHWSNLLYNLFCKFLRQYKKDIKSDHFDFKQILNIEILKYENNGFYTWHVDHFAGEPRTMSCILLLNNDYEGGNLCFSNPDGSEEWEVEVKPSRLIIWPSNFLYPHTVKPVKKGTRYSVVAWAL